MAALGFHRKAAVDSVMTLFIPDGATTTAAEMAREDKRASVTAPRRSSAGATQASSVIKHIPLALYVHIPWCERKCPYCDFNSHENFDPSLEAPTSMRFLTTWISNLAGPEIANSFLSFRGWYT